MSLPTQLNERAGGLCELCNTETAENAYVVTPRAEDSIDNQVALCGQCLSKITSDTDSDYWRCLEGSIWNATPSVQALSYRTLQLYKNEEWASDVLQSVDIEDSIIEWAMSAFIVADTHKDSFGNVLENGDTVILTQNLDVKGTSFSAPKGTVVKRIRLVPDNTKQIEGKINDQTIVILTKYVKKG